MQHVSKQGMVCSAQRSRHIKQDQFCLLSSASRMRWLALFSAVCVLWFDLYADLIFLIKVIACKVLRELFRHKLLCQLDKEMEIGDRPLMFIYTGVKLGVFQEWVTIALFCSNGPTPVWRDKLKIEAMEDASVAACSLTGDAGSRSSSQGLAGHSRLTSRTFSDCNRHRFWETVFL